MVPPFGSTPVALSVTMEVPSPMAGFGLALAETPGGEFGGVNAIGTNTVAVDGVLIPGVPTVSWNVRLKGLATTGATKLAVAPVALFTVTIGSPAFTIWVQTNGPASGKLPCELSVTSVPAIIGVTGDL